MQDPLLSYHQNYRSKKCGEICIVMQRTKERMCRAGTCKGDSSGCCQVCLPRAATMRGGDRKGKERIFVARFN